MKNVKLFTFLLLLTGSLFTMQSCEILDNCADVTCNNGGTCVEGICDCPEGFSGTSCDTEDLCVTQGVICQNGGTCNNGICEGCDLGYEGDLCTTLSREKMLGEYTLTIVCGSSTYGPYDAVISTKEDPTEFKMSHFEGSDNAIYNVVMTGEKTFDMPNQDVCSGCLQVQGTGSIDDSGVITMNTIVGGTNNCVETFTPK